MKNHKNIYFVNSINDEFMNKNKDRITELDNFIKNNRDNIHMIITSPDMYEYLKLLENNEISTTNNQKYLNIPVTIITYFPSNGINFIFKHSYLKFNIPCICGYYNDESHP